MTDTQPRPFDERAALDELERLAEKIQSTRRQRERAVAEFNAFVKTFKDEDHAARWNAVHVSARTEVAAVAAAPLPAAARPAAAPLIPERRSHETAVPVPVLETVVAVDSAPEPRAWSAPRSRQAGFAALLGDSRARLGLAAAGVLVAVLLATWLWGRSDATIPPASEPAGAPAAQAPASAPAATPTSAQPTPVASTGPPRALNIVLTTSRPVWTRVTVDDRKVIERELPGAQTIPLGADRAIVIRAGDAGAIRVVVDGKDAGVLGRDGQIASRSFTAKAR